MQRVEATPTESGCANPQGNAELPPDCTLAAIGEAASPVTAVTTAWYPVPLFAVFETEVETLRRVAQSIR